MAPTGITAHIYRSNGGDTSNRGISTRVNKVTVIGTLREDGKLDPVRGPFTPTDDAPAVILVRRHGVMGSPGTVHARPYGDDLPRTGWMAGGTYIATSDSRLVEAAGFYGAISLHDRREW